MLSRVKSWRWMLASKIGTSHLRTQTPLQDSGLAFPIAPPLFSMRRDFWFAAIVSDGAGSTSHGGEGAEITCQFLKEKICHYFKKSAILPSEMLVKGWIEQLRAEIDRKAHKYGKNLSSKDFACTLVLFLGSSEQQMGVHIGDGAVVLCNEEEQWECFSPPHHGEYASTTYFVTDAVPEIRIVKRQASLKGVCVFSDGLEGLALNLADNVPHQPFFKTLAAPLKHSFVRKKAGLHIILSKGLGTLLMGEKVCSRTDDDKTLILALVK